MPRKGENIYKRKDGRWEGRYRKDSVNGKTTYGYVYARTYREARQKLHDAVVQWKSTPHESITEHTFAEYALRWEQSLEHRVKDSTRAKYHTILRKHLLPALGELPLSDLTHRRLEDHALALLDHGASDGGPLSPRTVSDVMVVLRSILRSAARDGVSVPCDGSTVRIRRTPTEIKILSRTEQETLCGYLFKYRTPRNAGILLSLYAGLRVGEVCALRWEDIDCDEGVLHIRRTVQRIQYPESEHPRTRVIVTAPKSPSSLRTIPLPAELTMLLAALPSPHEGWFLTGADGCPMEPRCMQRHFRQVLQALCLPPTNYHTLRHTFATRCVELGFDVKALSELLGHSTVTMTMDRYVHPTMHHKRTYMTRLTSLLPDIQT